MITTPERLASEISARIVPQLRALAVGQSMRVRGYKLVTRCDGEDRFQVEGDTCTQKATEAAYEAVLADLESHVKKG
jgi:hypothetical protein